MNLARLFARLSLYRASRGAPTWILVALALGIYLLAGIGKAYAQDGHPMRADAWVHCQQQPNRAAGDAACAGWTEGASVKELWCNETSSFVEERYVCQRPDSTKTTSYNVFNHGFSGGEPCPTGWKRNNTTGECEDPNEACKALNNEPGFLGVGETARPFVNLCAANGCNFGIRPGSPYTATDLGTSNQVVHGQFEWTGACTPPSNPPPDPAPEPQQHCETAGSMGDGTPIKLCVQKDGRHCITAPKSGKQLCWTPGETGEKTTENILQKREGGDKAQSPTPPNKPDLTQEGPSVKTTTTKHPTGTVITTTTTNWKTNDNTNAGPNDDGVPDTGDDSGGDSDQGSNEASGDGTCNTPWQTSGDAILGAILGEAWKLRCAGEKANEDNTADAGTLGGIAHGLEPGEGDSIFGDGQSGGTGSGVTDNLYSWGSGNCPVASLTFTMGGHEFVPPAIFCDTVAALSALFQLAALVWAMRIVGS